MIFSKLFKRQPKQIKPNYFLFTATWSKDFELKNSFEDNPKLENARKLVIQIGESAFSAGQDYVSKKVEDIIIHLFVLNDKRKDHFGRATRSYFGVIVDSEDKTFDINGFVAEIMNKKKLLNKKTYTAFDLANEYPIHWREDKTWEALTT